MWNNINSINGLIKEHLARRPAMQTRDLYKLLYQGVSGPEHLIASPTDFMQRLAAEWDALEPASAPDPLWESIRPDGDLLRLNLRPYKAGGGRWDELSAACLQTGSRFWGGPEELKSIWGRLAASGLELFGNCQALDEIETFTTWLETEGFPSVHHSEPYRRLYQPAYRLLSKAGLSQILP